MEEAAVGCVGLGVALADRCRRRHDGDATLEQPVVAGEAADVLQAQAGCEPQLVLPRQRDELAFDVDARNGEVVALRDAEHRLAVGQRNDGAAVGVDLARVDLGAAGPAGPQLHVAADHGGRLLARRATLESVDMAVCGAGEDMRIGAQVPALTHAAVLAAEAARRQAGTATSGLGFQEELHHAADGVLAVHRRRRALDELHPFHQIGRQQREVGIAL